MTSREQTKIIAWVDHDETAVREVVGRIGSLVRLEKDRKPLKDIFRLIPVIVPLGDELPVRARDLILQGCARIPDLVLVDLAFGPLDTSGIVEIGRSLAHSLMATLGPVPVGIYSRYPCPRPIKRYQLASDGFAVVLEDIRKTYENVNVDECMTGDEWARLFEKIIDGSDLSASNSSRESNAVRLESTFLPRPKPAEKKITDVGIITVREDEFETVLARFKDRCTVRARQHYEHATVTSCSEQAINVAIARCPEQGQLRAQAVANEMLEDLDPKWLFLVGIAGGMPETEFSLGDVIVATRFTDFAVSAALEDKPPEFNIGGGMMHPDVENVVAHLPAYNLQGWNNQTAIGRARPSLTVNPEPTASEYYGDSEWRKKVIASLSAAFPKKGKKRIPKYVARPIISSNTLVKSTDLAKVWREVARHVAAVEMELAGVYMAASRRGGRHRVLAIRGLSDIVGYQRSPEWTRYACETAAAFAHAVIVGGIVSSEPPP